MTGYSGKPLNIKLGIKQGYRIALVDGPDGIESILVPLPEDVSYVAIESGGLDVVLLFSTDSQHLTSRFCVSMSQIKPAGMIWVAWPKKAAKAQTDLDENIVRDIGLAAGLVDVKVCAIDDYWSGLKFVIRLKDRK